MDGKLRTMGRGRQIYRTVSSYGKTFCRYETRPAGCLNPRCRFQHRKPKHLPADTHLPSSKAPDKNCQQEQRSQQLFKTRSFQKSYTDQTKSVSGCSRLQQPPPPPHSEARMKKSPVDIWDEKAEHELSLQISQYLKQIRRETDQARLIGHGGLSTSSQPSELTTLPIPKETSTPTAHKRQSPSSSPEESMGEGPACKRRRTQPVCIPSPKRQRRTSVRVYHPHQKNPWQKNRLANGGGHNQSASRTNSSPAEMSSSSLDYIGLIEAFMSLSLRLEKSRVVDRACSQRRGPEGMEGMSWTSECHVPTTVTLLTAR